MLGVLAGPGLSLAGEVLPRLPSSVRQIWAAGGGGARPLRLAVAQRDRFVETRPLSGLVRVQVEVRRPLPTKGEAPDGATTPADEGTTDAPPAGDGGGSGGSDGADGSQGISRR